MVRHMPAARQMRGENGSQIFYLHGLPGSRLEGKAFFEKHLSKFGASLASLIDVKRPGIGLSSPHPGSTISDQARDVIFLVEHLGLEEWRVIGVSGGSPFALACARRHPPERLRGVAIWTVFPWLQGHGSCYETDTPHVAVRPSFVTSSTDRYVSCRT